MDKQIIAACFVVLAASASSQSTVGLKRQTSDLETLQRRISGAFFHQKTKYFIYNRYAPKTLRGSSGRRMQWIEHNHWLDEKTLARQSNCYIRIAPFIWRKSLESRKTYSIVDSGTVHCQSTSLPRGKSERQEIRSTTIYTVGSSGDSLWFRTAKEHYIDSAIWVKDCVGHYELVRESTWGDTLFSLDQYQSEYDTIGNRLVTKWVVWRSGEGSFERTRACLCDASRSPLRCESLSPEGEPMVTRFHYSRRNESRSHVSRIGRKRMYATRYRVHPFPK